MAVSRRGTGTLDDRELLDACRDGDLGACRDLTARHAPAALRAAYLLTGNRTWSVDLVSDGLVQLFGQLRRGRFIDQFQGVLLERIADLWRGLESNTAPLAASRDAPSQPSPTPTAPPVVRRTQEALARLDDHQRAAVALHTFGGMSVETLAGVLRISPELTYVQVSRSGTRLMDAAGLNTAADLSAALNAVALNAPRIAIWPLIESRVSEAFEQEDIRQRRLSIGVAVGVFALLAIGVGLIFARDDEGPVAATPTAPETARSEPAAGTAFTVLPTATATPLADVGDTLLFSSNGTELRQSWRFEERLEDFPLLGDHTLEAGPPLVAPDGQQVYLIWYEYADGGATALVGAFDGELDRELWRVVVANDAEVEPGGRVDIRLSLAADHERVFVARQAWQSGDVVEIDVLDRADGLLLETIPTNLAGFAAHDVRLQAPPGSNQINLFAITGEAPPETDGLQITYLAYAVPGGARRHGRILFDIPDSRTFFLYDSQLITGTQTLFGVEQTIYYNEIGVHLFDLERGRLEPRRLLPFQPVATPLPYQQAVSHDGHWLYVLSPASIEVAVFNLYNQSLAGIVPLDPGILTGETIGVSYPQGRAMQISPDGARIYAEGTLNGSPAGIWVLDATSWTIIDHWAPGLSPAEIVLSGDGETLYARVASISGGPSAEGSLIAIDTASGAYQTVDIGETGRFSVASIATLYQRTYANSPAIDGHRQVSLVSTEPLAAAQVSVSQAMPGDVVTVEVRFVHPLTGEAVIAGDDSRQGGARYEPPFGVRARWTRDGSETPLILELGRAAYGHYQGFIRLDDPGDWTLLVTVDWPDHGPPDRSLLLVDAVEVRPPVTADGEPIEGAPAG